MINLKSQVDSYVTGKVCGHLKSNTIWDKSFYVWRYFEPRLHDFVSDQVLDQILNKRPEQIS